MEVCRSAVQQKLIPVNYRSIKVLPVVEAHPIVTFIVREFKNVNFFYITVSYLPFTSFSYSPAKGIQLPPTCAGHNFPYNLFDFFGTLFFRNIQNIRTNYYLISMNQERQNFQVVAGIRIILKHLKNAQITVWTTLVQMVGYQKKMNLAMKLIVRQRLPVHLLIDVPHLLREIVS